MVKNLEKELALLKQELAIHDSLVRDWMWGRRESCWEQRGADSTVGQGQGLWGGLGSRKGSAVGMGGQVESSGAYLGLWS